MKDRNTQRLLDDAEALALEAGFDEVSELDALEIVEDEME
jgi:hypothetical protein